MSATLTEMERKGCMLRSQLPGLTLNIELFEEPDRNSESNGIREPKFERAACHENESDPSEACEYYCGQQRRSDFLLCPGVKIRERSVNGSGSTKKCDYQGGRRRNMRSAC